ncbi:unnamed protein product [Boreogadus saida]
MRFPAGLDVFSDPRQQIVNLSTFSQSPVFCTTGPIWSRVGERVEANASGNLCCSFLPGRYQPSSERYLSDGFCDN